MQIVYFFNIYIPGIQVLVCTLNGFKISFCLAWMSLEPVKFQRDLYISVQDISTGTLKLCHSYQQRFSDSSVYHIY